MTATGLSDFVDSRVGIIKLLTRLSKGREEPELPIVCQAILSHFDYRKGDVSERTAAGKGLTEGEAMRGAIAEALERYCAYQQRSNALVFSEASTLDAPALPPEAFVLYSERQYARPGFPYRRPPADKRLTWVRAHRPSRDEKIYVPASLVYMNFSGATGSELFTLTTSNGLAAGSNLPSAVLSGFCELIERDAFVITWLNRLPVPEVAFADGGGMAGRIRHHYRRFGIEIRAFDMTTDIRVPVIMALAIDRSGSGPAVVVGLGCHLRPAIALDKALMEICQMRVGAVPRYRREPPGYRLRFYRDVRTLEDHAAFVASAERLGEFAFLLENPATVHLGDMVDNWQGDAKADLQTCTQRLDDAGSTPTYVDLTQDDVAPYGITVVRSLATGLQPIYFGYGEERLGDRLFTVPRIKGYTDQDTTEDDLNPCPHPLA